MWSVGACLNACLLLYLMKRLVLIIKMPCLLKEMTSSLGMRAAIISRVILGGVVLVRRSIRLGMSFMSIWLSGVSHLGRGSSPRIASIGATKRSAIVATIILLSVVIGLTTVTAISSVVWPLFIAFT